MNKTSKQTSKLSIWGYGILLATSIVLLVMGLAPVGLLLIARAWGLDVTFMINNGAVTFTVFGLIILSILVLPRSFRARKVAIWVVLIIAITNMRGCLTLNGLRNIGAINIAEQGGADDRMTPLGQVRFYRHEMFELCNG